MNVETTPTKPMMVVASPLKLRVSGVIEKKFLHVIVNSDLSLSCGLLQHHSTSFGFVMAEKIEGGFVHVLSKEQSDGSTSNEDCQPVHQIFLLGF
jgi:hypothetical protein